MIPGRTRNRAVSAPLVVAILAVLATSACSTPSRSESTPTAGASASVTDSPSSSPSASEPPAPYYDVPAGVQLTEPGFALQLGEKATVAWKLPVAKTDKEEQKKKKKPKVAAVDIKVKKVEAATLKAFAGWDLTKAQRNSNPFFVRANVTNVGKSDLSGARMPLYMLDGTNVLRRASTFEGDFKPCASTPFPEKFKTGEKYKMCNVYLAPKNGRLAAVSFRPVTKFDPITWTGEILPYEEPKKGKGKNKSEDQ